MSSKMNDLRQIVPKIKAEVPEPKRCCYCVPLRYGLLVWGYVKLALSVLVFLFGAMILQMYAQFMLMVGYAMFPYMATGMLLLLFVMVDIGMTIVFLVGGHQKTIKLLRVFYIYSIVLLVISTILFITYNSLAKRYDNREARRKYIDYNAYVALLITEIVIGIASICVQIYIIILLRSEINKLTSRKNIRFSNVTQEVESIGAVKNGHNIETGGMYEQEKNISIQKETEGNSFDYTKF